MRDSHKWDKSAVLLCFQSQTSFDHPRLPKLMKTVDTGRGVMNKIENCRTHFAGVGGRRG